PGIQFILVTLKSFIIMSLKEGNMQSNINTYIVSTPGILGGRPRIDGTRIPIRIFRPTFWECALFILFMNSKIMVNIFATNC
ncbi:MAG: hypothetical protein OMM_07493, partial [Candidatus Magnetoglobus multicellularis str. Araruama]